ncbi:RagB/SusD family nutrient uptake outer membrane protein [Butyricimonas virosa]|uniref:RagB/SusD family nutrient uptake outer membrane protein n=1 Tax=Butyricimonas virosa TaxID=544645 RepID=UPI003AAADA2D
MKRTVLYGILILTFLCTTSCEKWLDVNPKSEIKADKLFDTEAGFKDALTGLYINMTSKDVYGANLSWQAIEFMAGQYDGGNSSYIELQKYNFEHNTSKYFINAVWAKEYNIISETNLLLESLEKKGNILNPTLYNVIKGEALAIRAMCHFDLIRLFAKGNLTDRQEILAEPCIPYVTEYSKEITDQQPYEATLQLLHQDINDALFCLKSDPLYTGTEERPEDYDNVTNDIFFKGTYYKGRETRLSYPAVLLLNARVYLWEGNQEKALEYAKKLIESYEQYVAQGKKRWATESSNVSSEGENRDYVFQGELLFALDVQKLEEYIENAYSEYVNGNRNNDRLIQSGQFVEKLFTSLSTSDLRFRKQWQPAGDNFLTVKIRKTEGQQYSNYLPLMRISEAYLIAAECLKTSNKKQAVEYMNFLKTKRNIPTNAFLPENISTKDLQQEIIQDYRRELTQEGQLFFCYKRLGLQTFPSIQSDIMTDTQYKLPYPDIENELGQRE